MSAGPSKPRQVRFRIRQPAGNTPGRPMGPNPSAERQTSPPAVQPQPRPVQPAVPRSAKPQPAPADQPTIQPVAAKQSGAQPVAAKQSGTQPVAAKQSGTQPVAANQPATRPGQAGTQQAGAPSSGPDPEPRAAPAGWRAHTDVGVAAALAVVAAGATLMPAGAMRILLTLPFLLMVPGYLLIQALRSGFAHHRMQDVLMGIGLSLPVVGLAALMTSVVPNGFTPTAIIAVTTITCVALAATAVLRRRVVPAPA